MTARSQRLRDCYLIAMHSSVQGGVHYSRSGREIHEDGVARVERWETEKVVDDPAEREEAEQVRNRVRYLVKRNCTQTVFGLICSRSNMAKLNEDIEEARRVVDAFNARARTCHVNFGLIRGHISPSDESAYHAVIMTLHEQLDRILQAVQSDDPKKVRNAASILRAMCEVLTGEQSDKVEDLVEAAASLARAMRAGDAKEQTKVVRKIKLMKKGM